MSEHTSTKTPQKAGVKSSIVMYPDLKAAIRELKDEWGFETTSQTITVAVRYLAQATRKGLVRIEFDIAGK
jgi:hypothetical protein